MRSGSATQILSALRTEKGLRPVRPDSRLEAAALQQARYMAASGKMQHTTRLGRDFTSRMRANNVGSPAAENIAHGAFDTGKLFRVWEDSPPHRRNMLDPRFSRFGLASATDSGGRRYWALVLGG